MEKEKINIFDALELDMVLSHHIHLNLDVLYCLYVVTCDTI